MGRAFPDDLREMAPGVERAHVRVLAKPVVISKLAVVHEIGNHVGDLVGSGSVSNVLAVVSGRTEIATDR